MTIIELLKRLLVHSGIALGLLYGGLVVVEKLIPGFVSPFVDLAQLGLLTLAISGTAVYLVKGLRTRWHMIADTLAFFAILSAAIAYGLTKFSDAGWAAYGLIGVGTLLALAVYYGLWMNRVGE